MINGEFNANEQAVSPFRPVSVWPSIAVHNNIGTLDSFDLQSPEARLSPLLYQVHWYLRAISSCVTIGGGGLFCFGKLSGDANNVQAIIANNEFRLVAQPSNQVVKHTDRSGQSGVVAGYRSVSASCQSEMTCSLDW